MARIQKTQIILYTQGISDAVFAKTAASLHATQQIASEKQLKELNGFV